MTTLRNYLFSLGEQLYWFARNGGDKRTRPLLEMLGKIAGEVDDKELASLFRNHQNEYYGYDVLIEQEEWPPLNEGPMLKEAVEKSPALGELQELLKVMGTMSNVNPDVLETYYGISGQ